MGIIEDIDFQIEEMIDKANHTTSFHRWLKITNDIENLKIIKENIIRRGCKKYE